MGNLEIKDADSLPIALSPNSVDRRPEVAREFKKRLLMIIPKRINSALERHKTSIVASEKCSKTAVSKSFGQINHERVRAR